MSAAGPAAAEGAAPPLVSVVVPAYNAEATIEATLRSVAAQTLADHEVVVVDDGSRDGTRAILDRLAAADPRIVVIAQANAGVAAARNAGIRAARGRYIATLDADDLWHVERLSRHVAAMEAGGERVGLVSSPCLMIDGAGTVIAAARSAGMEGCALFRHLLTNPVGNGSGALMRRSALPSEAPYDASLHARGAQGCEDFLIQIRIALTHDFKEVPEYLVGYRRGPGNMSADLVRMQTSLLLVLDDVRGRLDPPWRLAADWAIANERARLLRFLVKRDGWSAVWRGRPEPFARRAPLLAALALCVPQLAYVHGLRLVECLVPAPAAALLGTAYDGRADAPKPPRAPARFTPNAWAMALLDRAVGRRAVRSGTTPDAAVAPPALDAPLAGRRP